MRASEPLKSKRFAISLFAWSSAFFSSTLLASETISKEGISDCREWMRNYTDRRFPCRENPNFDVENVSQENRHLTFRAQFNEGLIRNRTTNSHDWRGKRTLARRESRSTRRRTSGVNRDETIFCRDSGHRR